MSLVQGQTKQTKTPNVQGMTNAQVNFRYEVWALKQMVLETTKCLYGRGKNQP